ncbi:MAG: hypothetical protein U0R71_10655 [Solirubrobacterales bacterium]
MSSIAARRRRISRRVRAGALALAALALVGIAAAPAAAAEPEIPLASPLAPSMTLAFAGQEAEVVGTRAVLAVKCRGPRSGTCDGTVTLSVGGSDHSAAFSVLGGHRQSLVVPLGPGAPRHARHRVRAVAETVQELGACQQTERFLRLR